MEIRTKILRSSLFKITSLNSISVLLRIFTGIITSKVIAIFVGPGGMALIGNFRNFISTLEGVSTLAFSSGIVKYVGDHEKDPKELGKIITTVLLTFLGIAFVLSTLIVVFSDFLCLSIFGNNPQYEIIFTVVAAALPCSVVSVLFISIINGLGKYNKIIYANIIANMVGVCLSVALIYQYQTLGALLSMVINPVLLFCITAYYLPRQLHIFKRLNVKDYEFSIVKSLAAFSLMILPSIVLSPFFSLQIRNFLINTVGLEQAGFWEAVSRISNLYLLFVTTLVSVYFYPKLIKAKDTIETKQVFKTYYSAILPVFIIGATVIYFSRFLIVKLLFTAEFLPVTELFFWQLAGDVLKVGGLILGFQFLAKKIILPYVIFEVVSNVLLYVLSLYFIETIGIQGVVFAQAVDNLVYLLLLVVYLRKSLFYTASI